MKEEDITTPKTLEWFDIFDSSEIIGQIFVALETIKVSSESLETSNDVKIPLLKTVQPNLRTYRSV